MRRFWIVVYGLTACAHALFAVALHRALSALSLPHAALASIAISIVLVLACRGPMSRARWDAPIERWIAIVQEPYLVHWCATILAAPIWIIALAISAARGAIDVSTSALVAYAIALSIASWGVVVRRRWVRIRSITITIDGLGDRFDGYRIAHLSDLHVGSLSPLSATSRWARSVRALGVDLVALTGDYVTSGTAFHRRIADAVAELEARDGVVAVMGNHDYFGDGEPLISLLIARGVRVLRNDHMTIARGEDRITIAGVDDRWTGRADIDRTLAECDRGAPIITLAHDPSLFEKLSDRGVSLVLSGHTHWGQIAMPFMPERINMSRLTHVYHAGIARRGASTLVVHPGLGTSGPPLRIGAPPEITVLELRRRVG